MSVNLDQENVGFFIGKKLNLPIKMLKMTCTMMIIFMTWNAKKNNDKNSNNQFYVTHDLQK